MFVISKRYITPLCPNCYETDVSLKELLSTGSFFCMNCDHPIDEEHMVDLVEKEDMYRTYLGAKAAGWLGSNDDD